jgi:hypothetical protein
MPADQLGVLGAQNARLADGPRHEPTGSRLILSALAGELVLQSQSWRYHFGSSRRIGRARFLCMRVYYGPDWTPYFGQGRPGKYWWVPGPPLLPKMGGGRRESSFRSIRGYSALESGPDLKESLRLGQRGYRLRFAIRHDRPIAVTGWQSVYDQPPPIHIEHPILADSRTGV